MYKGLKESGLRAGQTVAIVGAGGGLGSLACQYAKAMGFDIIAIDGGEDKKEMTAKLGKLIYLISDALVLEMISVAPSNHSGTKLILYVGARAYVDFMTSKDLVSDVKAATEDGLGPHAVILVAVNEKPFQQAAEVLFLSLS